MTWRGKVHEGGAKDAKCWAQDRRFVLSALNLRPAALDRHRFQRSLMAELLDRLRWEAGHRATISDFMLGGCPAAAGRAIKEILKITGALGGP